MGIGLILGVMLMIGYKSTIGLSDEQIEDKARSLGMVYEDECRSIFKGED